LPRKPYNGYETHSAEKSQHSGPKNVLSGRRN
jgi:hypothetical protein